MRLADLHPWFYDSGGTGISDKDGNPVPLRKGVGIGFDCPCGGDCGMVSVSFANPLDGGPPSRKDGHTWQRTGDTFETLTLSPSIQRLNGCKWHGWIKNGEVITC